LHAREHPAGSPPDAIDAIHTVGVLGLRERQPAAIDIIMMRSEQPGMDRRAILAGTAASLVAAGVSSASVPRMRYGAAAMKENFMDDPRYRDALVRHCDIIVPMNDLKWEALRPTRQEFSFEDADRILNFARSNGKSVRGHALCWYGGMPAWTKTIATRQEAERELITHIEKVAGRYAGRIPSWDVVNEAIAHDPARQGVWRDTLWHRLLGPAHIEMAFRAAAAADPRAELVYNDYDLETNDPREELRRKEVLNLVRRLQDRNIPIHAIGFQAHLYAERTIDPDGIARFANALKALGVKIIVTELDVIDWRLPAPAAERDKLAARHVETFLAALTATGPIDTVITWGITDRYSWVPETFKRNDSAKSRPLPLDEEYRAKPFMDVIERFRNKS
jgi:endo-1,4-beta-xylanase